MRTHKLIFVCDTVEHAKYLEEEILHVDFCDLTHWYCGLDHAGEDTPDDCLIYRGIIHPEIVTVELNVKGLWDNTTDNNLESLKKSYSKDRMISLGLGITDVKIEECDWYEKCKDFVN